MQSIYCTRRMNYSIRGAFVSEQYISHGILFSDIIMCVIYGCWLSVLRVIYLCSLALTEGRDVDLHYIMVHLGFHVGCSEFISHTAKTNKWSGTHMLTGTFQTASTCKGWDLTTAEGYYLWLGQWCWMRSQSLAFQLTGSKYFIPLLSSQHCTVPVSRPDVNQHR